MAGRNMEITVAKTAGFCFGVKRAVEKVYEQIATGKKHDLHLRSHHPQRRGGEGSGREGRTGHRISKEELAALKEGVVVIRSHGVGQADL